MADEGFREYYAAYQDAERAATMTAEAATSLLSGGGMTPAAGIVLGLAAIAGAIQAQTLGLRHAAFRAETPARWRE
jgi:hypothetical protein